MEKKERLQKINNELKSYINESNFISIKCRNKIIKILAKEFDIELPLENFASIDIALTEDGNIIMRGDQYNRENPISTFEEIEERYHRFTEQADAILKKKNVNYYNKKEINHITNLCILVVMFLIFIILLIIGVRSLLEKDYINCFWIIIFVSSWLLPSINLKGRWDQAKIYLKRKFKK